MERVNQRREERPCRLIGQGGGQGRVSKVHSRRREMREPGNPCFCRRCRTPVEVMRKAALHGDWHPVPTSLQTRCSPAGPERQSALNSRPLSVLCSTSTLSGPSTSIIWLHQDSRSFAVPPARLHVCPPVHAGMGMGMDSTWPQHANMPQAPSPHSLPCTLYSVPIYTRSPSLSVSVPARRATCPSTTITCLATRTTRGEPCCGHRFVTINSARPAILVSVNKKKKKKKK